MAGNVIALEPLREFSRRRLLPRRHTVLLGALVVLFAVRPLFGDFGFAPVGFSIALIALMLVSLYAVQADELIGEHERLVVQRKQRGRVGWLLAVPAVSERILIEFVHNRYVFLAGPIFWILFFSYIIWHELQALLKQREVTSETISMSISVYLLLGLAWSILYVLLFFLQPNSFSFSNPPAATGHFSERQVFPVLVYFSLVTIATVGYGDITPLSLQARYAAVAEAITGQFYLAILVARLVGLHMSRTANRDSGDRGRASAGENSRRSTDYQ